MSDSANETPLAAIPPDDPTRRLTAVDPDNGELRHVALAGNTYTILIAGAQTAGRYSLVDMHVPHGGGPPPHRHDFEEMFHVLDGEIEFTFRGEKTVLRAGQTLNIPANAPHAFANVSGKTARMLCLCSPAGQEAFFLEVGQPVDGRTARPPAPTAGEQQAMKHKAEALAPKYRTEMLGG